MRVVIALGGNALARRGEPMTVTGVEAIIDKDRAAAGALRQAIAHHADPAHPAPGDRRLGVRLVVRESTGPSPG